VDTVFRADNDDFLVETPDRSALWACQTPQTFRVEVIREAHAQARRDGCLATDDATLVRRAGHAVKLVAGTPLNIKVTTPADLHMASFFIEEGLVPCA
jgi:2-C-methyl-D-erythritol 4-phosphate cytidylyltransferase